jgi:hypothetical protein
LGLVQFPDDVDPYPLDSASFSSPIGSVRESFEVSFKSANIVARNTRRP